MAITYDFLLIRGLYGAIGIPNLVLSS
jgi:hypothetical protein